MSENESHFAPGDIEDALGMVGELLAARGTGVGIVIAGGAALNLLGIVSRVTRDVDVIGIRGVAPGPLDGLPPELAEAVAEVARDRGLPIDWINVQASAGLTPGTPGGWAARATWRQFGGLHVGLAAREDLLWLKLWALADNPGRDGRRHLADLIALRPTKVELFHVVQQLAEVDGHSGFRAHLERTAAEVLDAAR